MSDETDQTTPADRPVCRCGTALVIIDLQNDYFPGGLFPLPHAAQAGQHALKVVQHARRLGIPVVHVRHISLHEGARFFLPGSAGSEIHSCVAPLPGEVVVVKHRPNAFLDTELGEVLGRIGTRRLIIMGMMSNMCVDATVRAASDMGYACTVVADACAAADLAHDGVEVPAHQVHAAFMAALGFAYAEIVAAEDFVESSQQV